MPVQSALAVLVEADVSALSEEDLYAQLGEALSGTDDAPLESMADLTMLKADLDADGLWNWLQGLIRRGKDAFDKYWPQVQSAVCAVYRQYEDAEGSGWIEKAAEAIVAYLNIAWAAAVLIVKIAIKKGIQAMCPA